MRKKADWANRGQAQESRINENLNEKRNISPAMALRPARYFGTTADVWLGLQADYDLYWAKMKSKKTIDEIKPLQGRQAA